MGALERLADRLNELEAAVAALSSSPQLAASSIVQGAISQTELVATGEVDESGAAVYSEREVSRYGAQPDGGNTLVVLDGPVPPRPVAPRVTGGPGFLSVEWTGEFEDRAEPYSDHDYVAVHVSDTPGFTPIAATLAATMRSPAGETAVIPRAPGTWYVSLVAVSQAGKWSPPAPYSAGEPGEASGVDVTARELARAAGAAAAESRALAGALSAAASIADGRAIEAAMLADVTMTSADGLTRVTWSRNPPSGAARAGDTWFQVAADGVVTGAWECTDGDGPVQPDRPAEVTPVPPAYSAGSVTIPEVEGVTYLLSGRPVVAGEYTDLSGAVAVIATAKPGWRLSAEAPSAWVETLTGGGAGPALVVVEPDPPRHRDVPGESGDRLIIPAVTGVTYWAGGSVISAGEHPWSGTVRVTAAAQPGYVLAAGAVSAWTLTFSADRTTVVPDPPVFTDPSGTDRDTYTIPDSEGVTYVTGDGLAVPAGIHAGSGTVTVRAVPAGDGYVLAAGAVTSWQHEFDATAYATPAPPVFDDAAMTYTIPDSEGVTYSIGGVVTGPGTYSASAALVETDFTGADGAPWPAPWTRGWGRTSACQATLRSGSGQMAVAGTGSWTDKLWMHTGVSRADLDITYTVMVEGTSESWHHLILRAQQPGEEPSDCYDVFFSRSNVRVFRVVAWEPVVIGQSSTTGMTLGTRYRVRAQVADTAIRVKLWPAGQAEPPGWLIDVTDTTWTSGHYGFLAVGGSHADPPYTHVVDDVTVTRPGSGGAVTVTVTAAAAPGWTITPGAVTRWSRTFGGGA